MTAAAKPTKILPALAGKVRAAFAKAEPGLNQAPPSNDDIVRSNWRSILAAYVSAQDLEEVGKALKPVAVSAAEIRRCFREDAELRQRMAQAKVELSHYLFESSIRVAGKAEKSGQYNIAGALYLRAAGTLNKADYGAKVVVGGDPEAPLVHTHTGNVTHTLTPDEAYMSMLEGGR